MKAENLVGERFGRWVIIGRDNNRGTKAYWICKCDCGSIKSVCGTSLRRNGTYSCGCYRSETTTRIKTKHGMKGSPIYRIWEAMRRRCSSANSPDYKNYGARGIVVCREWESAASFIEWALRSGYKEGLTIERKDNNGNYKPGNCVWADRFAQANNRRSNRLVTYGGKTQNIKAWSEEYGVHYKAMWAAVDRHGIEWAVNHYAN